MIKKVVSLLVLFCCLVSCSSSNKTVDGFEYGKITEFSYDYNNSYGGYSYSYDIEVDDSIVFSYYSMEHDEYGTMETTLNKKTLRKIENLVKEYKLGSWNGFDEVAEDVMDGDGFSLSIDFSNDESIDAYGSNSYPVGYNEFKKELNDILMPIAEEMMEKQRQKIIDDGLSGNLEYVYVYYKQQGKSGDDEYDFMIKSTEYYGNNFYVSISTESEAYQYNCTVDDSYLWFDEVQKLIEKYNLI